MKKIKKSVKKIYFIRSEKTPFGGAEVYLSRLSRALTKKNIDHQIINSSIPKFFPSWARVILFNIQVSILKGSRFYFSLDRITCPDIYRAGDGVHKVFLSIEKKSKINLLHPVYLFLEKRCFENANRIITNSEMVKKNIIDSYGISSDKIITIYSGIELKDFDYEKSYERLSSEFDFKKDTQIILFVGSGYKRKGVYEFLQIIAKLKNKDVIAIIIGKEKNIKYYQSIAIELSIQSRVIFTGAREDVDDFYTISDIFLFPTHYEPFGNVILEAMNHKNVVFTTMQNGACEILSSEFIMQSPSDFSVANKIDKLLVNKKKLITIKDSNRKLSKKYSIEKNFERTFELIDGVKG
jgi:UDP-glucose:(heptosyl)LPS alpha-1,3-glucosyltransferase